MTAPLPSQSAIRRVLLTTARLIAGYIAGVAVGSVLFVSGLSVFTMWGVENVASNLARMTFEYFLLGALFGIPYTVLGTIVFKRWLPKSKTAFLLLGMMCPASAALLLMIAADLLDWALVWPLAGILVLTIPAGLAAAYIYGAIGMGYGFSRWRFA